MKGKPTPDTTTQIKQDPEKNDGEWGGNKVIMTNIKATPQIWRGESKIQKNDIETGVERQQVQELRNRYKQVLGVNAQPPECFVA